MGLLKLTLLLTLVVAIFVMEAPSGVNGTYWRRGRGHGRPRGSSESRDNDNNAGLSPSVLSGILRALNALDARVRALEKKGCNSGVLNITVCDDNNGTSVAITECTSSQLISGNITEVIVPVNFTVDFDETPTVVAGLTGASFFTGKDSLVEVEDVTLNGFNIKVTLEGILPFELRLFWIACNRAAMI